MRPWLPAASRVGGSLVVLGVFVALAARLSSMAAEQDHFVVAPSAIAEELLPGGLPPEVMNKVRTELAGIPAMSLFEPQFAQRFGEELMAASPWVADVRRVERLFPNRARADIVMRTPVASVDVGDERLVLDAEGRVLLTEPIIGHVALESRVLRIKGVTDRIVATPGASLFSSEGVKAAVLVAAELRALPEPEHTQFWSVNPIALDVTGQRSGNVVLEGFVWVETANGVLMRWGRAQDWDWNTTRLGLIDLEPRTKVSYLVRILATYPGLAGLEEVQLNGPRPYVRPFGGELTPIPMSDPWGQKGRGN